MTKYSIRILLIVIVALFLLYLFFNPLRVYLSKQNIDAGLVVGFLTIITLLVSLLQNSYDKKFNYNLRIIDSLENKGLSIISKLLTIRQKSEIILSTLNTIKEAIKNNSKFVDLNNTLSKKDIDEGADLIAAYIDTYFKEECSEWNELINKLNIIGSYNASIISNYRENLGLIMSGVPFENESLKKIDDFITDTEKINKEINKITLSMRDKIVIKINTVTGRLKNSIL